MSVDIKKIRKKKYLTQKDVADQVGISNTYYSLIETGLRRPSPPVAQKLASVLGFPNEWYKLLETTVEGAVS